MSKGNKFLIYSVPFWKYERITVTHNFIEHTSINILKILSPQREHFLNYIEVKF